MINRFRFALVLILIATSACIAPPRRSVQPVEAPTASCAPYCAIDYAPTNPTSVADDPLHDPALRPTDIPPDATPTPPRYGDVVPAAWDVDANGFVNSADVAAMAADLAALTQYLDRAGDCLIAFPITPTTSSVVYRCPAVP